MYHILLYFKYPDDGGWTRKHVAGNKLYCCVYYMCICRFYK